MKKLIFVCLALFVLILSFSACSSPSEEPDNEPTGTETPGSEGEPGDVTPETVKYTVSWYDENGVLLYSEQVEEGTVPQYSYAPTSNDEWRKSFDGWSLSVGGEKVELSTVTGGVSYYALVSTVKQTYTITFNTGCEVNVAPKTVEYGEIIEAPEVKRESYRLIGWFTDENKENPVDWTAPQVKNATYYAAWEEVVDVKALLLSLLNGYNASPYSYIPESMRPDYSSNLVGDGDVVTDYSSFVNVSDIAAAGFGEQWNMIVNNIQQSQLFFNALSAVETVATASVTAFNNYFDKNPADTAHHTFASGIYSVTVDFDGKTIYYVLDYTATISLLGEQTAQIALSMDVETGVRSVRVQLGDANALAYTFGEGFYEFGIRYLGVRRAYFMIRENDGVIDGHIYEYLTVSDVEVASAADFYITEDYVSAVGNKADGIIGFNNYISELYDVKNGKLIGYEVRETKSALTFNTLWFDLASIPGINSIKYVPATDDTEAAIYVNGSSTAWEAKDVGGFSLKYFSRRFDIEFKTRYFYQYDSTSDEYVIVKAQVPMLFVQEENLDTLVKDVKETNGITVSVSIADGDLKKLLGDYDVLVDAFIANKDAVTVHKILEFIGTKVTFE